MILMFTVITMNIMEKGIPVEIMDVEAIPATKA